MRGGTRHVEISRVTSLTTASMTADHTKRLNIALLPGQVQLEVLRERRRRCPVPITTETRHNLRPTSNTTVTLAALGLRPEAASAAGRAEAGAPLSHFEPFSTTLKRGTVCS